MKEKWSKWVRLTTCLSIVLGTFLVPGPAAAKTLARPELCGGEPTPTPQVVVTEELPPMVESTPTEGIPSPTATASETTATSAPTDTAQPTLTETPVGPTETPTATPTDEVIPRDCSSGRRASGVGTRTGFCAGEEVFGNEIGLDTGEVCSGGNCWLPIAPQDGWVRSGVVNPWPGEVPPGTNPWIEPACSGRRTSGDGLTTRFCQGEEVFGVDITLDDGNSCSGGSCWLSTAPMAGWVRTGVVNPWPGEVPSGTTPWYPYGPPPATETPVPPAPTEEAPMPEVTPAWEQNPELALAPAPAMTCRTQNGTPMLPEQGGMVICWHSPTDVEILADRPFNIELGLGGNGPVLPSLTLSGVEHLRFEDSSSGHFILWGMQVGTRFRADGSMVAKYFESPVLGP